MLRAQPKSTRYVSEAYLDFIREQPCCVCGSAGLSDPHHVRTRGAGGSDLLVVPLCRAHHIEVGTAGTNTFQDRYGFRWSDIQLELLTCFVEQNRQF